MNNLPVTNVAMHKFKHYLWLDGSFSGNSPGLLLGCCVRARWQFRQALPETEKGRMICPHIYSLSNTINVVKGKNQHSVPKCKELFKTFISATHSAAQPGEEADKHKQLEASPRQEGQGVGKQNSWVKQLQKKASWTLHAAASPCANSDLQPAHLPAQMTLLQQLTQPGAPAATGVKCKVRTFTSCLLMQHC